MTLKRTSEKSAELDEEGGYYTPQEMSKFALLPSVACQLQLKGMVYRNLPMFLKVVRSLEAWLLRRP